MNECAKYKFISTTIRPTKVPYPELYDYEKCSKFISEFLEYEELNPPNKFPEYIPAPDNVLYWQIGDCFDFSIVLCSLLIGAGYNAFVVYGVAPRFITTKDESNLPCPDLPDDIKVIEPDLSEKGDGIEIKEIPDKPVIESELDKNEMMDKEKKKQNEYVKLNVIDDDQPELERHDPWLHKRIHAWVLLKRNKRIERDIYVEPSTGRIYDVNEPPYEKVDAIFNNFNFYINLLPDKPAKEIDLNFNNTDCWEYVMLNNRDNNDDILDEEMDEDANKKSINKEDEKVQEVLDMPPPWPNKLTISLYSYNNRSPMNTQIFYHSRTRIDKFSAYSQADGMVTRICRFKDYARLVVQEVEYRYRNRTDKLYKRIKYPYEHRTIDMYLPGQKYGWKIIDEVESVYKKVYFYPTNFSSGLIYREEIFGKKIVHRYISRDDRVIERKVLLDKDYSDKPHSYKNFLDNPLYPKRVLITKFTQKYVPNNMMAKEEQIAKITYVFDKTTKMNITYHYAKGKIIAKTKEFEIGDNESSLTNEDKESDSDKYNNETDKLKKKIYSLKNESINSFSRIEDDFNSQVVEVMKYYKDIMDNKNVGENNEILFRAHILEKNIFDQELSNVYITFYKYFRMNLIKIKIKWNMTAKNKDSIE